MKERLISRLLRLTRTAAGSAGCARPTVFIASAEMTGHTIYQVESVEVGVELAPDTFTLQPSTASDRGR